MIGQEKLVEKNLRHSLEGVFEKYVEASNRCTSYNRRKRDLDQRKRELYMVLTSVSKHCELLEKDVKLMHRQNDYFKGQIRNITYCEDNKFQNVTTSNLRVFTRKRSLSDNGSTEAVLHALRSPKKKSSKRLRQKTPMKAVWKKKDKCATTRRNHDIGKEMIGGVKSMKHCLRSLREVVRRDFQKSQEELSLFGSLVDSYKNGSEYCEVQKNKLQLLRDQIENDDIKFARKSKELVESVIIINRDHPMICHTK